MLVQKQDLLTLPWEVYANLPVEELEQQAIRDQLTNYTGWMLPQMLAWFGSWTPVKGHGGLLDCKQTALHNIGNDPKLRGLFLVATKLPRSKLVKHQATPQNAAYGALVPLVLAGFKKYRGIGYAKWDPQTIKFVVDKNLCLAMTSENIPDLEVPRLLEIRELGLTTKSGRTEGQKKNPLSTWSLTGIQDTELGHLPKLAQTMLVQIWLAHPQLRNEYMVLDPKQWDRMPPPLVDAEIFKQPSYPTKAVARNQDQDHAIPWEA